ncbi:hypothetical protein [Burkholderia vietnamiensis]|uniref:hypothetical protein n=1 Tax=Burkholderia vietnamiensis TaxID=60552 RepID=UPI001CF22550|nr:hypothetical protein [Burkholderia vietnamiensis]MCA8198313.1 hypothetical protein [Burkholderia vietnamiensis]
MKEPILSADELTHAARALLMAVLGAPHDIERASVTVHFDESKQGHNALNQMSRSQTTPTGSNGSSPTRAGSNGEMKTKALSRI